MVEIDDAEGIVNEKYFYVIYSYLDNRIEDEDKEEDDDDSGNYKATHTKAPPKCIPFV